MNLHIRPATLDDIPELIRLIDLSARELGRTDYTSEQIEAALGTAWGVDTQLIHDQTFFVVVDGTGIVACGGWSKRRKRFGADQHGTEPELLDPARDAARIRAFFVHPHWARRGLGRMLLERCEAEARAAGFNSAELVATLPGERLYRTFGYVAGRPAEYPLKDGISITFIPMTKQIV